jgi:hypothetical protein
VLGQNELKEEEISDTENTLQIISLLWWAPNKETRLNETL